MIETELIQVIYFTCVAIYKDAAEVLAGCEEPGDGAEPVAVARPQAGLERGASLHAERHGAHPHPLRLVLLLGPDSHFTLQMPRATRLGIPTPAYVYATERQSYPPPLTHRAPTHSPYQESSR